MENGWCFPSSYGDWKSNVDSESIPDSLTEFENGLFPDDVMVRQPVEPTIVVPARRKKKKRLEASVCETFYDKYSLGTEVLGQGAYSLVTIATEKKTEKEFAVKIIEKYEGYDRGSVLREIDLLHYLADCPNVLHLHDSYEENDRFYLIFERMEGGPLLSHIEKKGTFTEKEASLVVKDIAIALKFLHDKGISHRDLKPDNILCMHKKEVVPAMICDFNLASGIDIIENCVTTPELYTPVGSAEYMAPEVVDAFVKDAVYDKKCDLWSLGVILYIMLSGRAPFQGNCGEQCDWERGGSCRTCKSLLWHSIMDGNYTLSSDEWNTISIEAKDLISHLLVKEVSKRYSIDDVLSHPWMEVASYNELNTPNVLAINSSSYTSRLSSVTSEAVACRRIISERLSSLEKYENNTRWSTPPKLSPTGHSSLAKRRSIKNKLKPLTPLILNNCSPNNTPMASPDVGTLIEKVLQLNHADNHFSAAFSKVADYHDKFLRLSGKDTAKTPTATDYNWQLDDLAVTPTLETKKWNERSLNIDSNNIIVK